MSLTQGFRYISGRCGIHNRIVEHNVAMFSELSLAVHWLGRLSSGKYYGQQRLANGKLLTPAMMVDILVKEVDECPLNRGH